MTIRDQIQTTLRALAEIPAVVELVREGESMRRTHVETALRLQLAKKQAHIERLQYRSSKCGADVAKALRDVAKWRDKFHAAEVRAGEELAKNLRPNGEFGTWQETVDDLRNELGPARGLIAEQKRQLESCSARIRELETKLSETRMVRDEMAKIVNSCEPKTMADLWRPVGDEEWSSLVASVRVLVRYSDKTFSTGRRCDYTGCSYVTHYVVTEEPPR